VGEVENVKRQAGMVPGAKLLGYKMAISVVHPVQRTITCEAPRTMRCGHRRFAAIVSVALKKEGYQPDVIAAHAGWGDTLFLREVFPDARIWDISECLSTDHAGRTSALIRSFP
jgi:hypothetical protein